MPPWLDELQAELATRRSHHLLRHLRAARRQGRWVERMEGGGRLLNLAGNDYLALSDHPRLRDAATRTASSLGVGAGASRLVVGSLPIHEELEARFAAFKHVEQALLLPTGYQANLAALTSLSGPGDLICLDKLCHASLIDAARAGGASVRVYPHGDLNKLERLLSRTSRAGGSIRRRLIVTDAVFSMDGDCADLPALCELRDRHDAILVVDEAHATGVLGENGSGLAEHQSVGGRIDVTISTASKALGSLGGIVTANEVVIQTLINHARSFIYTTAVPPTQAAAIGAAMDVLRDEPQRRRRLAELSRRLRGMLRESGWPVADDPTPIIPLIVGDPSRAIAISEQLASCGIFAPAIRPPTVPRGGARLRLSLRCDVLDKELERLVDALGPPPQRARKA